MPSFLSLSQRRILSKVAGRVEDILRRTGEFVPPGGAVISLLPPGRPPLVPATRSSPSAFRFVLGLGGEQSQYEAMPVEEVFRLARASFSFLATISLTDHSYFLLLLSDLLL